jgi:hypothetical protein
MTGRLSRLGLAGWLGLAAGSLAPSGPIAAQEAPTSWYALNVPSWSGSNLLIPGGWADNQRVRLMVDPRWGAVSGSVAYEHLLQLWENRPALGLGTIPGTIPQGSTGWLDLSGTIASEDHLEWVHRLDRLWIASDLGSEVTVTVGRQTISWASTLFLTPADPFAPFDPADPFREYRAGVDALRVQWFPGAFSEVDGVLRAQDTGEKTTLTALVRGRRSVGGWDLSGWGGMIHDEFGAAVAAVGAIRSVALRTEVSLRQDSRDESTTLRGSVGLDHFRLWRGKDLYLLAEYQRDGFGASDPSDYLEVATSEPFTRGELQTVGRDTGLLQGSYQVHPLVSVDALFLVNLNDGSGQFGPGASWSVAREGSLRGGVYIPWGDEPNAETVNPEEVLQSEYGSGTPSVYLSLSWFW